MTDIRKMIAVGAMMLCTALCAEAQTMDVTIGQVTYSYQRSAVGEMTFDNATTLNIGEKAYSLSDVSRIFVNPSGNVTDHTVSIAYSGKTAAVTVAGDLAPYMTVTVTGADVTIVNTDTTEMVTYTLSGTTTDGQLLLFGQKKATMVLDNVSITNADGPAINNQCSKGLYIELPAGTTSTLTDGKTYTDLFDGELALDQKGTLFSEGQIHFMGSGTLTVNGNCKNAIASDDFIVMEADANCTVYAKSAATASNGVKVNDGMFVYGGTLNIDVKADGARGIKCDSIFTMTGGNLTISTSGDPKIEIDATTGLKDTTSCACIKADYLVTFSGGVATLSSSGDGGKCINADRDIVMTGGTLTAKTTGSNDISSPKAVKTETNIYLSGGSFTATTKKSRATDCANVTTVNGEELRLPIISGTPKTKTLEKKKVIVIF